MQQICKKSSSMKRMVYLVACLPFWLTSCEEKVTALHFNEAEQVFEIGKESELRFLNETFEIKDKNMEAQTLLTDAGKELSLIHIFPFFIFYDQDVHNRRV